MNSLQEGRCPKCNGYVISLRKELQENALYEIYKCGKCQRIFKNLLKPSVSIDEAKRLGLAVKTE